MRCPLTEFSPCLISNLPVHLTSFVPNPLFFFLALREADAGSRVGQRTKLGHPADRHKRLIQVPVMSVRGIQASEHVSLRFITVNYTYYILVM